MTGNPDRTRGEQALVLTEEANVPHYLISFNQQWVGDHPEEWFASRGPLAMAVVGQMRDAGVLVFAGGLVEEIDQACTVDATSGTVTYVEGPYGEGREFLGGLTIVDVPDEPAARMWAAKVAEACGWPQQLREFKEPPLAS